MLDISNVVRITVLSAGAKLANANTSALALVTHDKPLFPNYGDFRVYMDATGVAKDFGSNSKAAKMASAVFSQTPNVKSGGGYLIVIPLKGDSSSVPAQILLQSRNISELPSEFTITFNVNGETQNIIASDLDKTTLQTFEASLNQYLNPIGVNAALSGELNSADIRFATSALGSNASLTIVATENSAYADAAVMLNAVGQSATGVDGGEEQLKEAILRSMEKVYFFGVMFDEIIDLPYSQSRLKEVSQLIQGLDKTLFVTTNIRARVTDNFQAVADGGFTHTRCLFHGDSFDDALIFQAAYAGRALSVNYSLENSAITMNGKTLSGIGADKSIDQTFFNTLRTAGTDFYGDFGIPKVISNGANKFYDDVANLLALKLNLQIGRFNSVMSTPTKIPQTEDGMGFLKSNDRQVLEKFRRAGVIAAGNEWNSETTYGDPEMHRASIRQLGYWIYSTPLALQEQSEREQRIAAATYFAVKFAGAVHTSDLVLFVEV